MKSDRPKVLHEVAGKSLVRWVLDAVAKADPVETRVVIGNGADEVRAVLPEGVQTAVQAGGSAFFGPLVEQGVARGDIDPDLDLDLVTFGWIGRNHRLPIFGGQPHVFGVGLQEQLPAGVRAPRPPR